MEFKGTKGEWTVGKSHGCVVSDDSTGGLVRGATGEDAIKYYGGNLICESVSNENAQLIAAAPELLEALQSMLNIFDRNLFEGEVGYNVCEKSKQAINKALGL